MRLKYDDTHSDPEFSESEVQPLNARFRTEEAFPRTAEAFRSRFVGGGWSFPRNKGGIIHVQRIPGQNGGHHI